MATLAVAMLRVILLFLTGEELVESTVLKVFSLEYTGKGCSLNSLMKFLYNE